MASSGTMTGSNAVIGGVSGSHFYINWQLASQSVTNNTSTINWQAKFLFHHADAQLDNGVANLSGTRWSNGGRVHDFAAEGYSTDRNLTLASGSFTITHDSDGTKDISVSGGVDVYGVGRSSGSQSFSLPTIPRNSQVTTDKSSYNIGDDVVISTNRKSSSFTHTITIRLDNSSGTVLHTQNNVGSSWTWTPSASEITTIQNHIPTSNSLKLYINQYNNQVKANSNVSITENITGANPTFSDFDFKDNSTATVAITGDNSILVKGQSTLLGTVASADKMVANKGSSANHYAFSYDGVINQVAYATTDVTSSFTPIATIGSRTILVNAYDSRGNATQVAKNVMVYDYVAPIIQVSVTRENNFGENVTIKTSGTFDLLPIAGANKNSLTASSLQYRYKNHTDTTFGSWTPIAFTVTDNEFTGTDALLVLDNSASFDFEFQITDKFGTVTQSASIGTGTPLIFIGENGTLQANGSDLVTTDTTQTISGDKTFTGGVDMSGASSFKAPVVAFEAYLSATITGLVLTTYTLTPFNVVSLNKGNGFSTSTHVFTAPIHGVYHFDANLIFNNSAQFILGFSLNGSLYRRINWDEQSDGAGAAGVPGGLTIELNPGDAVGVYYFTYDGSDLTGGSQWSSFSGHLVGQL